MTQKTTKKKASTKAEVLENFSNRRPRLPGRNYTLIEPQRLYLLELIAEGLTTLEINNLGASFDPPFEVSPQLVYQYRTQYAEPLRVLREEKQAEAFETGLGVAANRVKALMRLARMLEEDLEQKEKLWLANKKMVGAETYEFHEFNKAEIETLRGIYDDIAKETGGRIQRKDILSGGKPIKGYTTVSPDDWDEEEPKNED